MESVAPKQKGTASDKKKQSAEPLKAEKAKKSKSRERNNQEEVLDMERSQRLQ